MQVPGYKETRLPDADVEPLSRDELVVRVRRLEAALELIRRDQIENPERRLRAMLASSIDTAIIGADRDGLVTDWNTGAERIFGWTLNEMRGQPADRFFTPEDRAAGVPAREMLNAVKDGRASDERWHMRENGDASSPPARCSR